MIDFEPISSLPDFSTPLWRSRNLRFVGHTSISPCMDGSTQQPKPTVADKFSRSGRVKGNLSGSHCTEQPISIKVADTDWLFGTMGAAQVALHPPRTGKFVSDGWFRLLIIISPLNSCNTSCVRKNVYLKVSSQLVVPTK